VRVNDIQALPHAHVRDTRVFLSHHRSARILYGAGGEPATIQVQVIPFLPEPPLCEIAIVAGHANVGEPARHGSDSSSDTVTSDGFVAVKPIPPPRSITEVTAPGQAGTPQIAPLFETPPTTPARPSKPAAGVSNPPGFDHVALDMGGDIDPM
jgi:hypothetical protein